MWLPFSLETLSLNDENILKKQSQQPLEIMWVKCLRPTAGVEPPAACGQGKICGGSDVTTQATEKVHVASVRDLLLFFLKRTNILTNILSLWVLLLSFVKRL